jgi:hypothetical protein
VINSANLRITVRIRLVAVCTWPHPCRAGYKPHDETCAAIMASVVAVWTAVRGIVVCFLLGVGVGRHDGLSVCG